MIEIECRFCGTEFSVARNWIVTNGRVFCTSCCKAFDVRLGEEYEEQLPLPAAEENEPEAKIEVTALEELEKEMDQAVEEFVPKENDWSWY